VFLLMASQKVRPPALRWFFRTSTYLIFNELIWSEPKGSKDPLVDLSGKPGYICWTGTVSMELALGFGRTTIG